MSPFRSVIIGAATGGALVLTALLGAAPIGAPTSAPTPTPTPTRTPDPVATKPEQVFDGDCSAVLSDAEASLILATSVIQSPLEDQGYFAVPAAGAMNCFWGTSEYGTGIDVVVLPEGAGFTYELPEPEDEDEAAYYSEAYDEDGRWCGWLESGAIACTVDVTAHGVRISGIAFSLTDEKPAVRASAIATEQLFVERAEALEQVAPAPTLPAGAWDVPVDCEAVAEAATLVRLLDVDGPYLGYVSGGTDVYSPDSAAWPGGVPPECGIGVQNSAVWLYFAYLSGGRWAEPSVAALSSAPPEFIEGLGTVYTNSWDGSERWIFGDSPDTRIVVFSGVNMLQFWYDARESLQYAGWLVDELDALSLD